MVTLWLWLSENQRNGRDWIAGFSGVCFAAPRPTRNSSKLRNGWVVWWLRIELQCNGANKFTFGDESQKVLKVYGVEVAGKRAEI